MSKAAAIDHPPPIDIKALIDAMGDRIVPEGMRPVGPQGALGRSTIARPEFSVAALP